MAMSKKMIKGLRKDMGPIATALDLQERTLSSDTPRTPEPADVVRLLMYRILDSHARALKEGLEMLLRIEDDIAERPEVVARNAMMLLASTSREALLQYGFEVDTLAVGPDGATLNGRPIGPKPEQPTGFRMPWDGNVH